MNADNHGDSAELRFTATNSRPAESERLLGITSPAVEGIRISEGATLEIPPKTSIAAGQPVENVDHDANNADRPFRVTIGSLPDSARPDTTVDMTFHFAIQGDVPMKVPVEACPTQVTDGS